VIYPTAGVILSEMAKITRDDVLKLAQLAKLTLTEQEIETFLIELNDILQFVDKLQEIDVSGLAPTSQVTGLTNMTRSDTLIDYGYAPSDLLKNVPAVEDSQIKVRRIL
jgi:aspartyl-tRNA(Asn)/glutamyl-tRNA(Gln) amidotransferase subunit C